jgi:hypothetical protein
VTLSTAGVTEIVAATRLRWYAGTENSAGTNRARRPTWPLVRAVGGSCGPHYGWLVVYCGAVLAGRMMQRKPRWLVEVSTGCAIRAAGR